jgi:hypothetical protein
MPFISANMIGNILIYLAHTSDKSRTLKTSRSPRETSSSTDKPVLGQTSDDIPSTVVVVVSVLLVLFVIVAVIFLALWLKRRSAGIVTWLAIQLRNLHNNYSLLARVRIYFLIFKL